MVLVSGWSMLLQGRVKEKRLSALVSGLKAVASPDPDKYKLVTIQDLT